MNSTSTGSMGSGSVFFLCVVLTALGAQSFSAQSPTQTSPTGERSPPEASSSKPTTPTPATPGAASTTPGAAPATPPSTATFKPEELEQLVAPIALYPDSLLSQVLMASTYPLQVVEAARWQKANPKLKDKALTAALEKQDWDPSVKSLINFPEVLVQLDEKLDWTQKLGDAVLAQQKDVLAAVQRLRGKAVESGNLKTTEEQKVTTDEATTTIIIEAANPQVVYVPAYNPTVVYGTWPYPAYPPYYYYPPGYVATRSAFSFMAGVAVGAAWGYAWGGCHWGHGEIDIDIDKNVDINRDINRDSYKQRASELSGARTNSREGKGAWQHDPANRKGVNYRDSATAQKYGRSSSATATSRESFRGYSDRGRAELQRSPTARADARAAVSNSRASGASRASASRPSSGSTARSSSLSTRGSSSPSTRSSSSSRGSAFEGYGRASDVKRQSSRGQVSRQSSPSRSAARSGGGGGTRGGGGRRR